jgi:hypothetical protein
MYQIEHVINAKATAVKDGRETELKIGDWITQEELATLKVYGSKLIYRIDQNCTGEVCGIDIEAHLPEPTTISFSVESPVATTTSDTVTLK